jgi:hypothetical protein
MRSASSARPGNTGREAASVLRVLWGLGLHASVDPVDAFHHEVDTAVQRISFRKLN